MANTVIKLSAKFDLEIRIRKSDQNKLDKMLTDNVIIFFVEPVPFAGFVRFMIPSIGIRKAEVVRQLLQNITVYD